MNEIIKESTNLYHEIDDCITNLIKSRLDKDENKENEAIFKMESLLVNTMQHISWLVGTLKECSLIKWHTGEPKKEGEYLISNRQGKIHVDLWSYYQTYHQRNCGFWSEWEGEVIAWCKLSDIKPYKEETK